MERARVQETAHPLACPCLQPSPRASSRPSPPSTRRHGTPAPIRPAARPRRAEGERFNPFISARLPSRARGVRLGRRPLWLDAGACDRSRTCAGRIVAAAPCYLKSHSQGEYVFDHAWADAYERAGGRYYPKLQVAAPFTPATGRRLLVAADAPEGAREALIERARAKLRKQTKASSIHVTFPTAAGRGAAANAPASSSATASSSISRATASRTSTIFSPPSPHASARRSSASGATRSATRSRSNG